jgi:hypothetical protein
LLRSCWMLALSSVMVMQSFIWISCDSARFATTDEDGAKNE